MDTEQQSGQEAVELTVEQYEALRNEVKAEMAASRGEPVEQHAAPAQPATDAPSAADEPAPDPEPPAADPPPPKEPTVAELQAQIVEMRTAMESQTRQSRNQAGALGGLQQKLKEQETALAEARTALAQQRTAAPTPDQVAAASKSGAKWDALKSDYPEWADAIEERFGTAGAKGDEEAIRRVEQKAAQDIAAARADALRAQREAEATRKDVVESLHPGWEDTVRGEEFKAWMQKAGDEEQRLSNSDRPSDAIKLLNRFKYGANTAPGHQLPPGRTAADVARDRQQRLTTAVTPPRGTAGSPSAKSEQDMTEAEYRAYLSARMRAGKGLR